MKKGFTLIELLVVVLIIGILASVALPQYTKAVEKSRIAEAKILLKSLSDAADLYYLANGEDTWKLEDLDIEIPGTYRDVGGRTHVSTKNFEFYGDELVRNGSRGNALDWYADRINGNTAYSVRFVGPSYDGGGEHGVFYCWAPDGSEATTCPKIGATKSGSEWIFR